MRDGVSMDDRSARSVACTVTRRGLWFGFSIGLWFGVGVGCATPIPYGRFEPRPQDVVVTRSGGAGEEVARALVSVLGARRVGDRDEFEMMARLRIESLSSTELVWRNDRVQLVTADLRAFGTPRVGTALAPTIGPGETAEIDLAFPFPAGVRWQDLDLSSLHLTWALEAEDHLFTVGTTFQRVVPTRYYTPFYYYDDPWDPFYGPCTYPYPLFRTSIGFGYSHRH